MGFADPAKSSVSFESTLALTEASDQLIRYLRMVANNDVLGAIAESSQQGILTSIQSDPDTDLFNRTIKDIVLCMNTPDTPTTAALNDVATKTSSDESKTTAKVVVLNPEDFGQLDSLRSSQGEKNDNEKSTSISQYAIINSGQQFNYSDRGTEYVAMFSSLIPSVELSLCVPHFKLSFTQNVTTQESNSMPFLRLESFLGASQENSSPTAITSQRSLPSAHNTSPEDTTTAKVGTQTGGMELFLSPQTLMNPDINTTSLYQSTRGVTALDPFQPLMSIESIGIDVAPVSRNMMTTNTVINLSLVLHDRSRLVEIAPIVSPSLRPSLRAEVEFGWNHPDGNSFTNNPYAKFLNALKIKQVFTVTQATISSRDATSLTVKVTLTSLGFSIMSDISAYTGKYVEYSLVEAKMKQLFRIIETESNAGSSNSEQSTSQIHVGEDVIINTSNFDNTDKWIKYEDYKSICDVIENPTKTEISKLIEIYKRIIEKTSTQTDTENNQIITSLRNSLIKDLTYAWDTSSYYTRVIDSDALRSYFSSTIIGYILSDEGASQGSSSSSQPAAINANISLLGDVIYRLLAVPLSLAGFFDEIRITTYDFNDYAGEMGGMNIGSLPVKLSKMIDTQLLTSKTSCRKLVEDVLASVSDQSYEPYGIKAALSRKSNMESKIGSDSAVDSSSQADKASPPTVEESQAVFERTLTDIYTRKSSISDGKFSKTSYEPKFLTPQLKLDMFVMPVREEGNKIKQVLCVMIYDGANSGKSSTNLVVSALKKSSGVVKVVKAASDINTSVGQTNIFTVKQTDDGLYNVSINKSQASNILSAAYPTLKIGTEGSTIINASYSTMASGNVENAIQIQALGQEYTGVSGTTTAASVNANTYLTPSSLTISMLGMPLINRGQQYYVDFGTGTSIDNVYNVSTVKHTIKSGQFTTSVTLTPTNAATLMSIQTKIRADLDVINSYSKKIAGDTSTT